ncbi:unnamed protein product [Parnassius apollo]|uniref:(apollo) hypothetical protein n=1 Tax=Parnassius apollo TaxID=110799 RepID=A0A8S3YC97_PARAO|nr:unnamed protein product [Parnassius apollo]
MQQPEILNIKELVEPKRWLQDKTGEKVRWSDVTEYTKQITRIAQQDFTVAGENINLHEQYHSQSETSELDVSDHDSEINEIENSDEELFDDNL